MQLIHLHDGLDMNKFLELLPVLLLGTVLIQDAHVVNIYKCYTRLIK